MGLLEPRKSTGNLNSTELTGEIKFHCLCGCSYLQKALEHISLFLLKLPILIMFITNFRSACPFDIVLLISQDRILNCPKTSYCQWGISDFFYRIFFFKAMFTITKNVGNLVVLNSHVFATIKDHGILNITVINFKQSILNQNTWNILPTTLHLCQTFNL